MYAGGRSAVPNALGCCDVRPGLGVSAPVIIAGINFASKLFGGGNTDAERLAWVQRVYELGRAGHPDAIPLLKCWSSKPWWGNPGGVFTAGMASLRYQVTGKSGPKAGETCNGMATSVGREAATVAYQALESSQATGTPPPPTPPGGMINYPSGGGGATSGGTRTYPTATAGIGGGDMGGALVPLALAGVALWLLLKGK